MVEAGATHNLLSDREADPLSLTLAGDTSYLQQDFLMMAKESVVLHRGVVAIMDKQCPCMVHAACMEKEKALSTLQLKTRSQQGHANYLVASLTKEIGEGLMAHPAIMRLLEYNNLMPQELPKTLHPPHAINQCI
ncbi:hypothetical protein AMTR_s00047p00150970 [Amborella trichopoda]|uniref:Uncharacterized protein n=1 Tax=Amborella trichopoda TaxID=13333 RepID=U5D5R5_AMBTC|nr:hypothetical protein AMTR_s00047p00150970 [Amborella trichopoda]